MRDSSRTAAVLIAVLLCAACARERPASHAGSPAPTEDSTAASKEELAEVSGAPAETAPTKDRDLRERFDGVKAKRTQSGRAAYYSDSLAGNHTANGERYDPKHFTAAHRTYPFGTIVRVVRRDNGKHTYVRITDRGPFGDSKRVIDLSRVAAECLGIIGKGVADVRLEVVEWGHAKR